MVSSPGLVAATPCGNIHATRRGAKVPCPIPPTRHPEARRGFASQKIDDGGGQGAGVLEVCHRKSTQSSVTDDRRTNSPIHLAE